MTVKLLSKLSLIILLTLSWLIIFSAVVRSEVIGIEFPSRWGASWRFPTNSVDNLGPGGTGINDFRYLQNLKDGDVLVIGTHSNPEVFGIGNKLVNWTDFWKHFGVSNPPKLGAVVICGCMIDVTDGQLESIRSSFGAGALFTPRGSYGLPHILSTETIISALKDGKDLNSIYEAVKNTHYAKLDPSVRMTDNLTAINRRSRTSTVTSSTGSGFGEDYTSGSGGYILWINKFGDAGRIHIGSRSQYDAKKKYRDEWLAGMSEEYLYKEPLFGGRSFGSRKEAGDFICGQIANKRFKKVLGWGNLEVGDYGGKTYLIDGLGCKIPTQ